MTAKVTGAGGASGVGTLAAGGGDVVGALATGGVVVTAAGAVVCGVGACAQLVENASATARLIRTSRCRVRRFVALASVGW